MSPMQTAIPLMIGQNSWKNCMPPPVELKEHSEMVLEDGHEGDRRGLHKYIVDRQLVKMQTLVDWQEG